MSDDRSIVGALAAACLVLASCGQSESVEDITQGGGDEAGTVWFEDVASSTGVDGSWASGHVEGRVLFPEIMGAGTALFDMDNDGDVDAYVLDGGTLDGTDSTGRVNRLYRNEGDGTFADITDQSGDAADPRYAMGVAIGDFDEDGLNDIYVTNIGRNTLLWNRGQGRFDDVTEAAGVAHEGWGTSAMFVDYDADGDLDLFFSNYVFWSLADEIVCYTDAGIPDYCSPNSYNAPAPDTLYRNDGDGTFTDVSNEAGLTSVFGNGLGVVALDYNGDHAIDLFVANDQTRNQLWHNNGDGTFKDVAFDTGTALDQHGTAKAGMGTDAIDVDGDGDEDLLVVNLRGQSDSFYRNAGGYFIDDTGVVGMGVASRPFTRFGVGFADFNNDGALDLYEANGAVARPTGAHDPADPFSEDNMLLIGSRTEAGDVFFNLPSNQNGAASPMVETTRGAAFGDIDNDGRIDILLGNMDAPAHMLRNTAPDTGNFVSIRALEQSGRDALGALVTVEIEGQGAITRRVRSAYSYQSANDPRIHLGLGDAGKATSVTVRWMDGVTETFGDLDAGSFAEIRRGQGTTVAAR